MGKTFFISDTHFNHTNILKYEAPSRPFETVEDMNAELVRRWNAKVSPDDSVYILGDFCFDVKGVFVNDLLRSLNGHKYLIRGNHDLFTRSSNFDPSLIEWIKDYCEAKIDGHFVCMFHYPIAVWNRKHYGAIHLYGHVHTPKGDSVEACARLVNAYNVGADVNNLEPMTLSELMDKYGYTPPQINNNNSDNDNISNKEA